MKICRFRRGILMDLSEENHDSIITFWYSFVHLIGNVFPLCLLINWWFFALISIGKCSETVSFSVDRFGVSDSVIFNLGHLLEYQHHFIHIPDKQPNQLKEQIHWWNFQKRVYSLEHGEEKYSLANWGNDGKSCKIHVKEKRSCLSRLVSAYWLFFLFSYHYMTTNWIIYFVIQSGF